MFESLTNKFNDMFRGLSGRGRISEENVREAMREVRTALLEADVHYEVVKKFCDEVVAEAVGQEVIKTLQPGQLMQKICHDKLTELMGPVDTRIYFVSPGPTIIMMAGLQGSGKTTTCGKLSKYLLSKGHKPVVVACDLQRPAAIDQLGIVAEQVGVPSFRMTGEKNPVKVARKSIDWARGNGCDVVIIDTAGRLHIDEEMMKQAEDISSSVNPHQIYLVCDSMTGQDAVNSAKEFNQRLELDGVILTKFDSDARGGAALSVKEVTGKPIKFLGVGEKFDALEEFHPERMAGRILGMGDVARLVEQAQEAFDQEEAEKMQAKMAKGKFTLADFANQMRQIQKMGPLKQILKLLPGMSANKEMLDMVSGDEFKHMEAIINSMTPQERETPDIIGPSRRRRIAAGCGCESKDVSGLVKSFMQMSGMMKQMSGMGMRDRMKMAQAMSGGGMMPGGMGGKPKQRSKRLSNKERKKRRKAKRRR
jgi:signal recognition particle subunit SRP54